MSMKKQPKTFYNSYINACQYYNTSVQTHIVSATLESQHHLHLDMDKLETEVTWQSVIKALISTRDLRRVSLYSNSINQITGITPTRVTRQNGSKKFCNVKILTAFMGYLSVI